MYDGLWYGITVHLMQTISTYYGAINIFNQAVGDPESSGITVQVK